jgi:aspartyl-tRNA(Asn)/glutamyl-tRNA(Gln) amidotransferase subunit A
MSDKRYLNSKPLSLIDGIPISIKDILNTKNMYTTAGSNMLRNYIPYYDATIINKLKKCGSILIGKTNLDEFAMGSSTRTGILGICKNAKNTKKTVGGSSGGSANSILSSMCFGSVGSDTGGSIRQPASFCETVGLRPTYGRISRFGLIAFASSLDQIGIMSKDSLSIAILLQYLAGYDYKDSTSAIRKIENYILKIHQSLKYRIVGIPIEYLNNIRDINMQKMMTKIIHFLKENKVIVKYISLKMTDYIISTYYIIATAEASSNLSRFTGTIYGSSLKKLKTNISNLSYTRGLYWSNEVKRRLLLGTYVINTKYYKQYYLQAQKIRYLICEDFKKNLKEVDIILSPTFPVLPFNAYKKDKTPLDIYLLDIYNIGASLAGLPAISVNLSKKNIGIHIIGHPFEESLILNFAHTFEKELKK